MEKIKINNNTMCGSIWFIGWLFTIGILNLDFVHGVYAILLWPYYIGVSVSYIFPLSL